MTNPGRPAGGSVWFLGIDRRLTLWPQAPWVVSVTGALDLEDFHTWCKPAGCTENTLEEGLGQEGAGDLPLRSNCIPEFLSGPSHLHVGQQGLADP